MTDEKTPWDEVAAIVLRRIEKDRADALATLKACAMARERVSEYRALIDAEVRHREERAEEAP